MKTDLFQSCDWKLLQYSSVQFSYSVMSDSLQPHESQHSRPPCPSPTPGVHSDLHPSSQWCHPAISSWVVPFSSCPSSLPASESFPMSQLFAWDGQSTGVSALASFLAKKSQGWSPCSPKGLSRVLLLGGCNSYLCVLTCSVTSVVSDSLHPHGLQHARLPCHLLSPWACSNSCPLCWWG